MPQSLVTGNGNLLVAINNKNMLQDFYFPYVGMEDQIAYEHFHRIGIYTDNRMSWLYDDDWNHEIKYIDSTLISDSKSTNNNLGLSIKFNDFVYPSEDFFIRKLEIENTTDTDRSLKLFFAQDFHIYGDKQQDTAFYEPDSKALVHYRRRRYFWISGMMGNHEGVDSFTTGKCEYRGLVGTWKDAEDGVLSEHPIEQGSVDSTIQFNIFLKAKSKAVLYVWITAMKNLEDSANMHKFIVKEGPEKLLQNSINYWRSWVNKDLNRKFELSSSIIEKYKQSLLIIRTQIDNRGAIIAANDSDIMKFNKDTYSYMWPRDGAWVAMSLDNAGYEEITKRFFEFCADVITDDGYLLHKYNPDKSVGSSWHPWYENGKTQLPIQEDETALTLVALWNHYEHFRDLEFLQKMYLPLIKSAGNFITEFIDEKSGLPLPSYDLWEMEKGIFAYTVSTAYAGLVAASNLSKVLGHFNHTSKYKKAAEKMKESIIKYLYDPELKRFLRKIELDENGNIIKKDYMLDASMHGLWKMGLLPADDERIIRTNEAIYSTLKINTKVGGIGRFENDYYQRIEGDYTGIVGNPWIITTLWHSQWLMEIAKNKSDLKEAENIIDWTVGHMNKAGFLAEQLSPFNGDPLSVSPLTWSHSTFVNTILKYDKKVKNFIKNKND